MPTIFDNIHTEFLENAARKGLRDALKVARRGDFCVGYFNLRGWRYIDDVVESWQSDSTSPCRVLVGMQRLPKDDLSKLFGNEADGDRIDNKTVARLKRQAAMDFRQQLTIGVPNAEDEAGLRRLARQLRAGTGKSEAFPPSPAARQALPRSSRTTTSIR